MTNTNIELIRRVESFLYEEARLMDDNDYQGWLDLFDTECTYWIPSNKEDLDPSLHISILYCDRLMLENHIKRLLDGKAFAQSPQSLTQRSVTNIVVSQSGTSVEVKANFFVAELRGHNQNIHAGRSEYLLKDNNTELCIQKKKVILLGLNEAQDNVTFLL